MKKSASRLTEDRDGGRGCGGVGVLWHNSIAASPIHGISSDRICSIRLSLDGEGNSITSVIDVYLPCLNQGIECYRDHLIELESVVRDLQQLGPVIALGDFNAHLGTAEDEGVQNLQGVLLQKVLEQCGLSAVSQGALASGPCYTFCSGNVQTTVDYLDVAATSMLANCHTHPMEDLNTSDHLPITVSLVCDTSKGNGSIARLAKGLTGQRLSKVMLLTILLLKCRQD